MMELDSRFEDNVKFPRYKRVAELAELFRNIHLNLQKSWKQIQVCPQLSEKAVVGNDIQQNHRFVEAKEHLSKNQQKDMDELLVHLQQRDKKIENQNNIIRTLQDRLKAARNEVEKLHEQSATFLTQTQVSQKNQEESKRRVSELQNALEVVRLGMQKSLAIMEESTKGKEASQVLSRVIDYHTIAEEGQAAFNNMKAEIDYLLHNLTAREKQIKNMESTIDSLQESLKLSQDTLDNAHNSALNYLKETESLERLRNKYKQNIEALTNTLKGAQKEKQSVLTSLQSPKDKTEYEGRSILPEYIKNHSHLMEKETSTAMELLKEMDELLTELEKLEKQKNKGVSFMGRSADDYEEEIRGLQRQLKEAKREKELLHKEVSGPSPEAVNLAREMEEYCIKSVEAQAALEDMKDEMDCLLENQQTRDEEIIALEEMMKQFQETIRQTEEILKILKQIHEDYENEKLKRILKDRGPENNEIVLNLDSVHNELNTSYTKFITSQQTSCIIKEYQVSVKDSHKAMKNILGDMKQLIDDLNIQEEKMLEQQGIVSNLQESLDKMFHEIVKIQAKSAEYASKREVFEDCRINSEKKIEKLILELENAQEGLRQTTNVLLHVDAEEDEISVTNQQ